MNKSFNQKFNMPIEMRDRCWGTSGEVDMPKRRTKSISNGRRKF
ncbi:MAG: hypothetical protein RR642_09560 [Solibacillus sp.]